MTRNRKSTVSPTMLLQHGLLLAAVAITLLPYAWMISSSFKANADIVSDAIELIPRHPILDNYLVALADTPVGIAIPWAQPGTRINRSNRVDFSGSTRIATRPSHG